MARRQDESPVTVAPAAVVDAAVLLVRAEFPRGPEPVRRAAEELPAVRGDRKDLVEVVANLLRNAFEASGPSGSVEVETTTVIPAAVLRAAHPSLREVEYVVIRVTDDGPGFAEEARSRLFEPGCTTKPDGAGMGLAVAHGVATALDGAVIVESAPVRGSVVSLYLPAVAYSPVRPTPGD
jgi:two-component system cell cycle sensor histidine kinase/response regulator CckA